MPSVPGMGLVIVGAVSLAIASAGQNVAKPSLRQALADLSLLNTRSIQQELKFSPAQVRSIAALRQRVLDLVRPSPGRPQAANPEGLDQVQKEVAKVQAKTLTAVQKRRYEEIRLQVAGPARGLLEPGIVRKLKITTAQASQIRGTADQFLMHARSGSRNVDWTGMSPGERDKLRARWRAESDAMGAKCLTYLSPAQLAQWKKIIGKPFMYVPDPLGR